MRSPGAGRGDEVELLAVARVARARQILIHRADGDDVRVGGGPADRVLARVPARRDDGHALADRIRDGILQHARALRAGDAEVRDVGAVVGGEAQAARDRPRRPVEVGLEHADRHHRHAGRDARTTERVARGLRDQAGHERAVALGLALRRDIVGKRSSSTKS